MNHLFQCWQELRASKNQNPREGIETADCARNHPAGRVDASKNQNPREGIETGEIGKLRRGAERNVFKKPKSPRGD